MAFVRLIAATLAGMLFGGILGAVVTFLRSLETGKVLFRQVPDWVAFQTSLQTGRWPAQDTLWTLANPLGCAVLGGAVFLLLNIFRETIHGFAKGPIPKSPGATPQQQTPIASPRQCPAIDAVQESSAALVPPNIAPIPLADSLVVPAAQFQPPAACPTPAVPADKKAVNQAAAAQHQANPRGSDPDRSDPTPSPAPVAPAKPAERDIPPIGTPKKIASPPAPSSPILETVLRPKSPLEQDLAKSAGGREPAGNAPKDRKPASSPPAPILETVLRPAPSLAPHETSARTFSSSPAHQISTKGVSETQESSTNPSTVLPQSLKASIRLRAKPVVDATLAALRFVGLKFSPLWHAAFYAKMPEPAKFGRADPETPAQMIEGLPIDAWVSPQHGLEQVPDEWNTGDVILDMYEVAGILGEGGMGRVYKVHHRGWNLDLAVKVPRADCFETPEQRAAFLREAETWVNLGLYPHTVNCYYVRTMGSVPRVFVEHVAGGSLAQWIRDGRLYAAGEQAPLARMLDVAIQFAWGLNFSHDRGLVHQDVKPANVLLTDEGLVKVTDFGLSRAFVTLGGPRLKHVDRLVSSGGMTPAYCSPEQSAGKPLSLKTDIWSWGVSVLEMFIGEVTWSSGTVASAVLEEYLVSGPQDETIPPMPLRLSELLKRCFAENPDNRPSDFQEVVAILVDEYAQVSKGPYPRSRPSVGRSRSDELNNRGISLWDLDRQEEADRCFTEALSVDPNHPEATYNQSLMRWRSGRMTDLDVVSCLERVRDSLPGDPRPPYYLSLIHLERGDREAALSELQQSESLAQIRRGLVGRQQFDAAMETIASNHEWSKFTSTAGTGYCVHAVWSRDNRKLAYRDFSNVHVAQLSGDERPRKLLCLKFDGELAWTCEDRQLIVASKSNLQIADVEQDRMLWEADVPKLGLHNTPGTTPGTNVSLINSPDGRHVMIANGAGVIAWDVRTGRTLFAELLYKPVYQVFHAASPDGSCIATLTHVPEGTSRDRLTLWTIPLGRGASWEWPSALLPFAPAELAVTPGGNRIILAGGGDRASGIACLDLATGSFLWIRRFNVPSGLHKLRPLDNHTVVFFELTGRTWQLVDVQSGRCFSTRTEAEEVKCICSSPDGQTIAIGTSKSIKVGKLGSGVPQPAAVCLPPTFEQLRKRDADVDSLQLKAEQLLNQGIPAEALTMIDRAMLIPGYATDSTLLAFRQRLAQHARVVALQELTAVQNLVDPAHPLVAYLEIAFSPDGRQLLVSQAVNQQVAGQSTWLRSYNCETGRVVQRYLCGKERNIRGFTWLHNGAFVAQAKGDVSIIRTVKYYGLKHEKFVHWKTSSDEMPFQTDFPTEASEFMADKLVMTGSPSKMQMLLGTKNLCLWDVDSNSPVWKRRVDDTSFAVNNISWSPCGQRAVLELSHSAKSNAGNGAIVEVATGQIDIYIQNEPGLKSPVWSPDGKTILGIKTVNNRSVLSAYDVESGTAVEHEFPVKRLTWGDRRVAWFPDSRFVLVVWHDSELCLWDRAEARVVRTIPSGGRSVTAMAVSPSGRHAAWISEGKLYIVEFIWKLEFPPEVAWDDAARPHLETFLHRQTPTGGQPQWTEGDFDNLLRRLQWAGLGWIKAEGVRQELIRLAKA